MRSAPLLLLLLPFLPCAPVMAADASRIPTTHGPLIQNADERRLLERFDELEQTILAIRQELQEQRAKDLRHLRRQLEKLEVEAQETRYHNKACYWLAEWHVNYGDPEQALAYILRIQGSRYAPYKEASRMIEARARLALGDLASARTIAEQLSAEIPEFANLQTLVAFHEQIGQAAPKTAGHNLAGGPDDPATAHSQPWMLYCFGNLEQTSDRAQISASIRQVADPAFAPVLRVVVVSFGANPLAALGHFRSLPVSERCDLLWANPSEHGDASEWRGAWRFPVLPIAVLLGPDRRIMAIDPGPAELLPLAGLEGPATEKATASPQPRRGGKGSQRFDWR